MNFVKIHRVIALFMLLVWGTFQQATAATIRLQPAADTTIVEAAPDNNLGGTIYVNAGTSGIGTKNRGLYRFNLSSIPQNSKIKSAMLALEVSKEPNGGAVASTFGLHRVLKSWGEGNKDSSIEPSIGFGYPATTNEATWNSRFAFTTNIWTNPGAEGDYITNSSSSMMVYGIGDFPQFASTPEMIADVQMWLGNDSTNFGWLLKTESESTSRTARGFASREFAGADTNTPPYLLIEFISLPTISEAQITNGQFSFSFLAEANEAYVVEFKNNLAADSWITLTNIAPLLAPTNISVFDPISTNARFYRVSVP